jgi:hypothetical protein
MVLNVSDPHYTRAKTLPPYCPDKNSMRVSGRRFTARKLQMMRGVMVADREDSRESQRAQFGGASAAW